MKDPTQPGRGLDEPGTEVPSPSPLRLPGSGLTRQAIRQAATSPKEHNSSAEGEARPRGFRAPSIKGRVIERLRDAPEREVEGGELRFKGFGPDFKIEGDSERGAAALACLILEQIRRHGGTRISERSVNALLERLMGSFSQQELMDIEVEAYEIFEWLGQSIAPDSSLPPSEEIEALSPPPNHSVVTTIERAIELRRDLVIQYFTGGRAELTRRRVTPLRLEAEKYLHAYCHKRQDDRVFRVSRVRQVSWLNEAPPPLQPPAVEEVTEEENDVPLGEADPRDQLRRAPRNPQMSLLAEDP